MIKNQLMTGAYKDFGFFLPDKKFFVIPCGVNPRKSLYLINRKLADLISEQLGDETEWLTELSLLE